MSEEDLERYESEIELGLVQEYRAVLPVFAYVIETERRFYLANEVSLNVRSDTTPACIELELRDAWVWDMYRPARFVPEVRVVTFRDVNIERLPEQERWSRGRRRAGPGDRSSVVSTRRLTLGHMAEDAAATWYADHGYRILARNWRCPQGEIDILCARQNSAGCLTLVVCEVKARSSNSHGDPLEAVTPAKQRRLRSLATLYLRSQDVRYEHIRFDVAAATRHALHIMESAF
jgi:uncharacterized protein (TIGR00252 family)